jgi:hypothetical protein
LYAERDIKLALCESGEMTIDNVNPSSNKKPYSFREIKEQANGYSNQL